MEVDEDMMDLNGMLCRHHSEWLDEVEYIDGVESDVDLGLALVCCLHLCELSTTKAPEYN